MLRQTSEERRAMIAQWNDEGVEKEGIIGERQDLVD
jgi:hypothetical protein